MRVFTPCTLPNGALLKNRFVKAAMEENMAEPNQLPGTALKNLYASWASGGVGLIITGNVMVDRLAMTGPGGVVLEKNTDLSSFSEWATCAKQNDTNVIMQINHPGRQVFKSMGGKVLAPSNVALNMGKHNALFEAPRAMATDEICDLVQRFCDTALNAKKAGFDGVQIHAAHGYLISQFLSPNTNKRTDEWGGDIAGRSKLLFDVFYGVRKACGDDFIVGIKLNSADFQRGGFDVDDAIEVVKRLNETNVDFIELSGGSYEAPAMQGKSGDERTLAREAYFLAFAKQIAQFSTRPIMTTGGIKRLSVANEVVSSGMELVGIASALAYDPALVNKWQVDEHYEGFIPATQWKDKTLAGLANMALVKRQLRRLGNGLKTSRGSFAFVSLLLDQLRKASLTKRYRKQYIDN
ncbi:NADH:flavin oxidoreductase/NADH oxidase family protein [Glaciecola sp. MH2013]|uniref:NADH:flavin oxidoreductase/NADH oxidase family protein n=1 Tax=Glaciecola sp. MH2013 TaxID=2785524 RepID=UPI0018A061D2|nr:NADH:flavin oxidoreductase/NADH oxidase family protein [Glaciecola sp. MH2013]MBF7073005.1 NADH:flavin oxidoreductase/NADH oxidase family protein [Glaciecola sp. MH2013]